MPEVAGVVIDHNVAMVIAGVGMACALILVLAVVIRMFTSRKSG